MTVVYRPDLPRQMVIWMCNACIGTACEVSGDEGRVPELCPCGEAPQWRRSQ